MLAIMQVDQTVQASVQCCAMIVTPHVVNLDRAYQVEGNVDEAEKEILSDGVGNDAKRLCKARKI